MKPGEHRCSLQQLSTPKEKTRATWPSPESAMPPVLPRCRQFSKQTIRTFPPCWKGKISDKFLARLVTWPGPRDRFHVPEGPSSPVDTLRTALTAFVVGRVGKPADTTTHCLMALMSWRWDSGHCLSHDTCGQLATKLTLLGHVVNAICVCVCTHICVCIYNICNV